VGSLQASSRHGHAILLSAWPLRAASPNNRFEPSREYHLRWAKEGVDDGNKAASFDAVAAPRRSASSLGHMDTSVLVAITSAATGILGAALTFFLTKKKELQAEWRKQKLESYKDLLSAMNGVVGNQSTLEARAIFSRAANNIMLVAPPPVLTSLRELLEEIGRQAQDHSSNRHDELLTDLMYAIRDDLGIRPNRAGDDFLFKLFAPGNIVP
jgi:hypothetical protein